MTRISDSLGIPTSPGLSPAARAYQWLVDVGSDLNRLVNPSPERLAAPLTQAERRSLGVEDADPVILIGGYASAPASLEPLERSLRGDGFARVFVFEVPNNGLADIRYSAAQLARFVARVRRVTGARKVDLVAHSAGGIVARTYVQLQGGGASVDRIVTIATPHHGVRLLRQRLVNAIADSAFGRWLVGPSTHQLLTGSQLVEELDRRASSEAGLDGARLVSIFVDGYDGLLAPLDTGIVAGQANVRMLHPGQSVRQAHLGHFTLHRRSNEVYEVVRCALLDALRLESIGTLHR